ncbi:hypothetical protein NE237_007884 [Protea cynaroides]|uniref:Uncharacterized protein n=1 Tax=Protea cynaroides TaxID=273540 RepID=A0A9Q0QWJ7_9MAGN|nr:hypothetical protein NE237_007884 [Protea cynaroides]
MRTYDPIPYSHLTKLDLNNLDDSDEERLVPGSSGSRDDHLSGPDKLVDESENEGSVVREGLDPSEIACMLAAQSQGPKQRKRPAIGTNKGVKKTQVMKVTASKSTATRRGSETTMEGSTELSTSRETIGEAASRGENLANQQEDLVGIPPPAIPGDRASEGRLPQGEVLSDPVQHSANPTRREEIPVPGSKLIRESPAQSPSTGSLKVCRPGGKSQRVSSSPGGAYWPHWMIGKDSNPLDLEVARQLVAEICLPSAENFYLRSERAELYSILETDVVWELVLQGKRESDGGTRQFEAGKRYPVSSPPHRERATGGKSSRRERRCCYGEEMFRGGLTVEKAKFKLLALQIEDLTRKYENLAA